MTQETLDTLSKLAIGALVVIVPAIGMFVADWFKLRTKYSDLKVRMEAVEVDDTERTRRLSAEAQQLIQRVYSQQVEDIRRLTDEQRHQRDLIDDANSENTRLSTINAELQRQQDSHVTKIADLNEQVKLLTVASAERDALKAEVDRLHQRVQEMEQAAAEHLSLSARLQKAEAALKEARRLLDECQGAQGLPTPPILMDNGIDPASLNEEKGSSDVTK